MWDWDLILGIYMVIRLVRVCTACDSKVNPCSEDQFCMSNLEPGGNPSSLATKCPYNQSRNPIYFVRMYDSSNTLIQERLLAYEKIFAKYGKKQNLVLRAAKEIEHY